MEIKLLTDYIKGTQRTLENIALHFEITKEEAESQLKDFLDIGSIVLTINGYMLAADCNIALAEIVLRKSNFAYVKPIGLTNTDQSDVRVSGRSLGGYILGDKVYIQTDKWGDGTIVGLYKRDEYLVGTVYKRPSGGFFLNGIKTADSGINVVIKDDFPINTISDGDLVKCKIISSSVDEIDVSFEEVLVKASDVGADISKIIVSNDAPIVFPSDVLVQAKMIPQEISPKDLEGRTDFRNDTIVTIDGADALDFDDAVQIKPIPNGYEIGVHIADVSYYVRPNSPLDEEARKRGTSIYVADRVVPMLPTELSNGICSLNPNVDRLVLSVIMNVDQSGNVYKSKIVPGVINSHGRLTYTQVNDLFSVSKTENLSDDIVKMLLLMKEATSLIRKRRDRNGALNLDSTELKFSLDEYGNPVDVIKRTQGEGEKMIEDLMIIANVEVAKYLSDRGIPTLYRVHDNPPSEKIVQFKQFLKNVNLYNGFPATISSATISHWFGTITDPLQHFAVSSFLLRSLAKAKYSPDNTGHFGLAEDFYLHFTSPIRRYPDLIVHRTLRTYVFDHAEVKSSEMMANLESLGIITSACERKAVTIERKVDDLESAKYMSKHIGEAHTAFVTGITANGMYLELDNGIEGMMRLTDINPNYNYIYSDKHMDVQSTDKEDRDLYRLGSSMEVIIKGVTMEDNTIHLETKEAKESQDSFEAYENDEQQQTGDIKEQSDTSRIKSADKKHEYHHDRNSERKPSSDDDRISYIDYSATFGITIPTSSEDNRSSDGEHRSYGGDRGHSSFGDHRSSYGEHRSYGGDRGHSSFGDHRSSYGEHKSYGGDRSHSSFGEHRSYNHSNYGDDKPMAAGTDTGSASTSENASLTRFVAGSNGDESRHTGYGRKPYGHSSSYAGHSSYGHSDGGAHSYGDHPEGGHSFGHSSYGHSPEGGHSFGHSSYGHSDGGAHSYGDHAEGGHSFGHSSYGHSPEGGHSFGHSSYGHSDGAAHSYGDHPDGGHSFGHSSYGHSDGGAHSYGDHAEGGHSFGHSSYGHSPEGGHSFGHSSYGHSPEGGHSFGHSSYGHSDGAAHSYGDHAEGGHSFGHSSYGHTSSGFGDHKSSYAGHSTSSSHSYSRGPRKSFGDHKDGDK
jgi:ribonuclease R